MINIIKFFLKTFCFIFILLIYRRQRVNKKKHVNMNNNKKLFNNIHQRVEYLMI